MASSVRCIQKPVRIFQNTKNQCRQVGPCQNEQDKCTRQNRSEGEAPEQIGRLQNRFFFFLQNTTKTWFCGQHIPLFKLVWNTP